MPGFKSSLFKIVLLVAGIAYCLTEASGAGDFFIFMSAAGSLGNSSDIFTKTYVDGYHYFYSVMFALILKPFYYLPFFWVKFCWLLLNLGLYLHLFRLLSTSYFVTILTDTQRQIFLISIFAFSARFLHENLHASQITILILWCCVFGMFLIIRDKPVRGSALLALGINIKLLPIVFLPYLLYRGYFKAFVFTILFYGLFMMTPSLLIGHEYNTALLKSWFSLINPTNKQHVLDVEERSFHGLSTLLSTLLVKEVPDVYAMSLKRNIMDIPLETLSKVLLIVRLSLVAFTLYFLKWTPFRRAASGWKGCVELAYILLLIPLIFPHQQHYAFLFAIPAFAIVTYFIVRNFNLVSNLEKRMVCGLLAFIFVAGSLKLFVGEFNRYYDHFKILTYGALLLIPLLVWVSRKTTVSGPAKDS
jgi:hypothetical protein